MITFSAFNLQVLWHLLLQILEGALLGDPEAECGAGQEGLAGAKVSGPLSVQPRGEGVGGAGGVQV